jgi:hypothetical protein
MLAWIHSEVVSDVLGILDRCGKWMIGCFAVIGIKDCTLGAGALSSMVTRHTKAAKSKNVPSRWMQRENRTPSRDSCQETE